MNSDAARALFERALDGELPPDTQTAFEEALRADAGLREEYGVLEALRQQTRLLKEEAALPSVDLLSGVQQKLRARSGGKFYRDRFAEARGIGGVPWMLVLASLVIVAASAFFFLQAW